MLVLFLSNLMRLLVPLGLFVWSLFQPAVAGYVFMVLAAALAGYLFFADIASRLNIAICGSGSCAYGFLPGLSSIWTANEIKILRRYHLALRFPSGANMFSCCLNGIRLSALLWVPWLLWNSLWIPAGFFVLYSLLTASLSVRLDPFFFLSDAVRRGKYQFAGELATLQRVQNRLREELSSARADPVNNDEPRVLVPTSAEAEGHYWHSEPEDESPKEKKPTKAAQEPKVQEELSEKVHYSQPDFSPHPRVYGGC